jgi:hypothetical protein
MDIALTVFLWAKAHIDHWQTLVAGALALAGAGWTVRVINKQINQAAIQEQQRLQREEQAAKAVLPLALAELGQYAEDCIRLMVPYIPANGEPSDFPPDYVVPRIPDGTIEPLRDCARYASAEVAAEIRVMLGKLQVQHSRMEISRQHAFQGTVHRLPYWEGIGAVIDAAEVYTLTGYLLLYAREKSLDPPMSFHQRILTPLITAGLIDHAKLIAELDRRFPLDYVPPSRMERLTGVTSR